MKSCDWRIKDMGFERVVWQSFPIAQWANWSGSRRCGAELAGFVTTVRATILWCMQIHFLEG